MWHIPAAPILPLHAAAEVTSKPMFPAFPSCFVSKSLSWWALLLPHRFCPPGFGGLPSNLRSPARSFFIFFLSVCPTHYRSPWVINRPLIRNTSCIRMHSIDCSIAALTSPHTLLGVRRGLQRIEKNNYYCMSPCIEAAFFFVLGIFDQSSLSATVRWIKDLSYSKSPKVG